MEDTAALKKERLKLIVRNLKLLIESLESEVYSDVDAYKSFDLDTLFESKVPYRIGDDDDGYTD